MLWGWNARALQGILKNQSAPKCHSIEIKPTYSRCLEHFCMIIKTIDKHTEYIFWNLIISKFFLYLTDRWIYALGFCFRVIPGAPCPVAMTASITSRAWCPGDPRTASRRGIPVCSPAWRHISTGSTNTSRVVNSQFSWCVNKKSVWRIPGRLREQCISLSNLQKTLSTLCYLKNCDIPNRWLS